MNRNKYVWDIFKMRLMSRKQPPLRTNERGWGPSTLKMNMNMYNEYVQEMKRIKIKRKLNESAKGVLNESIHKNVVRVNN